MARKRKADPSPPFATAFAPLTACQCATGFGMTRRRLQVRAESQQTAIDCEEQWRVTRKQKTVASGEWRENLKQVPPHKHRGSPSSLVTRCPTPAFTPA